MSGLPQPGAAYLTAPLVPEYDNQMRYGMAGVAAMPYGIALPYGVPTAVPAQYQALNAGNTFTPDSMALAQGLEHNLTISSQEQVVSIQGQYGGYAPQQQQHHQQQRRQQQQRPQYNHQQPRGQHMGEQQMPNMGMGGPNHFAGGPNNHHDSARDGYMGSGNGMDADMGSMPHRDRSGFRGGPNGFNNHHLGGRGNRGGRGGPPQYSQDFRQQQQFHAQLGGHQQQRGRAKKIQKGLEDNVRRTVYISYIDQQVTEESLANFFVDCGTVMDCRICGDPNSAMRFAFIEFMDLAGAQAALNKTGCTLGTSQLRVLPSKTAIVPVNKELMPRSQEELERCSRTVYVANIDKKVEREDVRNFFEQLCGKVNKIRLLGDLAHSTRIAFIEFIQAEAAMAALNCSGALLGSLPLRVSPSKTPVRGDKEDKDNNRQQGARQQQPGSSASNKAEDAATAGEGGDGDANGADGLINEEAGAKGVAAAAAPTENGTTDNTATAVDSLIEPEPAGVGVACGAAEGVVANNPTAADPPVPAAAGTRDANADSAAADAAADAAGRAAATEMQDIAPVDSTAAGETAADAAEPAVEKDEEAMADTGGASGRLLAHRLSDMSDA